MQDRCSPLCNVGGRTALGAVISLCSPFTRANERKVSPVGGYTGVALSAAKTSTVSPWVGSGQPPVPPSTASPPCRQERAHDSSRAGGQSPAKPDLHHSETPQAVGLQHRDFAFQPSCRRFSARGAQADALPVVRSTVVVLDALLPPREGPWSPAEPGSIPHAGGCRGFHLRKPPCIPAGRCLLTTAETTAAPGWRTLHPGNLSQEHFCKAVWDGVFFGFFGFLFVHQPTSSSDSTCPSLKPTLIAARLDTTAPTSRQWRVIYYHAAAWSPDKYFF